MCFILLTLSTLSLWNGLFHLWIWIFPLLKIRMSVKSQNWMANDVGSDQTAHSDPSSQDLHCLHWYLDTWTVYQRHAKILNHVHTSCLRKLLKIKWQDRIPDTEVLKRAGMQNVHTLLKSAQLRWTGHVTRLHEERLPKKILYLELEMGKRTHGGQKKR